MKPRLRNDAPLTCFQFDFPLNLRTMEPAMTQTPETAMKWRVGLLVSTLTMGVALVVTGVTGWVQAKESSTILARSEMTAVWQGLRRELRRSGGELEGAFAALAADDDEEEGGGVSYIAVLDRNGQVVASIGRSRSAVGVKEWVSRPMSAAHNLGPTMVEVDGNGFVRGLFAMPRRMMGRRGVGGAGQPSAFVVVEMVSKEGPKMVSTALTALVIELGAGLVLLAIALLFWRLSVIAEGSARAHEAQRREMAVQLEKDKGLKALGRMSAVLGHELRNPIAALKGHAQLLLERLGESHPAEQQARTVVSSAERLETLTEEVLSFVRTGELRPTKVYLDDLAYSAVALSGVDDVTVSVPEETPWHLDRARMEQALINLLVNARQASGDETVDLTLAVRDGRLVIAVRDRGPGIPEGEQQKIFEPFVTGRAQGTGLGLALVKRIAESHEGRITAANHQDGGALFEILLPARTETAETKGEKDG